MVAYAWTPHGLVEERVGAVTEKIPPPRRVWGRVASARRRPSWLISEDTRFKKRPVSLSLGLTSNMTARLVVVAYRSTAFSAPGSRPARMEEWRGTKSWDTIGECEVRLRTPVPAPGLDLRVYLRWPTSEGRARSLRKRCGNRKVFVSRSWPPDL